MKTLIPDNETGKPMCRFLHKLDQDSNNEDCKINIGVYDTSVFLMNKHNRLVIDPI